MGRSTWAIILALSIASWVGQSRLLRAQIMRLKTMEYVEAGRSMGAGGWTLVMRYMVPNALGPVLVTVSFGIPRSEEHTSELQSRGHLVCRLLLENKTHTPTAA